jgi:hypothetical protein
VHHLELRRRRQQLGTLSNSQAILFDFRVWVPYLCLSVFVLFNVVNRICVIAGAGIPQVWPVDESR